MLDETRALTEAERRVLVALSQGEHITYSQDGEVGWLVPSRVVLSDEVIWSIRDAGYIAKEPEDDDEHARFGPPDIITDAGRRALARATGGAT